VLCCAAISGCAATTYSTGDIGVEPKIESFGACNPAPCLKLIVSPLPPLPDSVSAKAREAIYSQVASVAYAPIDEADGSSRYTPVDVTKSVKRSFEEIVDEGVTSAPLEWSLERLIQVPYWNDDLITLDLRSRGYLGGAHGFDERYLLTFRIADGARLKIADIVEPKSLSLLSTIAEAEVRRARAVPAGQSLQDAGFTIAPNTPLAIPNNFGVTETGLLLRFNPYEIAPYSLGPTEITLPNEAIGQLLSARKGPSSSLPLSPVADAPPTTVDTPTESQG
jgi:hypothetical protein